jgi:hypothetical protein
VQPDSLERQHIARRRLIRILGRHGIALARTLEQKIADAGPFNQRIDPHILTIVRRELMEEGRIVEKRSCGVPWYHLRETAQSTIDQRLAEQEPVHIHLQGTAFGRRLGQALEIAVFRALSTQNRLDFFGHYLGLDDHSDDQLYQKDEPPSAISGRRIPGNKRLDFLVISPAVGAAGVEVKNLREWQYPRRAEIRDLLSKCCYLDAVPVLIARRIPYVTFSVLSPCGVILHQTYNQLFPAADAALASQARDKRLLGYHDIRLGNQPDARLIKFIHENLPRVLPSARARFMRFKDLVQAYAAEEMSYPSFAARVRRREQGLPEDGPWATDDEEDEY